MCFGSSWLIQSLSAEPSTLAHLVRLACIPDTEKALERLLNRRKLTSAQIDALAGSFRGIKLGEGLRRAMAGERCSFLEALKMSAPELQKNLGNPEIGGDGQVQGGNWQ